MREMLSEWGSLSERMAGLLVRLAEGGDPAPEREAAKRIRNHTPLCGVAVQRAVERPAFKPEIRKGKLYFSCPACQRPTAVFKSYAGKNTRCPSCLSAVRAPDPHRGRKAYNLERDIDAYLHPDRVSAVLPKRRTIATFLPLPSLNTLFAALGVNNRIHAALVWVLAAAASKPSVRIAQQTAASSPVPSVHAPPSRGTENLSARAIATVEAFLSASGPIAKSQYVADGARVSRLMAEAYSAEGSEPLGCSGTRVISTGLTDQDEGEAPRFATRVLADLPAGRSQEFIVHHSSEGDVIEWEASTGYNPQSWSELAQRAVAPGRLTTATRVLACPDNYYNYAFANEDTYYCVRLEDPESRELLGYGYATRTDAERMGLLDATMYASSDSPERLTLELEFTADSVRTKQVKVSGLAQRGWRALDGAMLATNSLPEP